MRSPERREPLRGRAPAPWAGRLPRGRAADAVIALTVFAVVAGSTLAAMAENTDRAPVPGAGWALMAVACGALYRRRARPVAVTAVTLVACGLYYPLTEPDGPIVITFVIALYTAAAAGRLAAAGLLGAAGLATVVYGEVRSGVNHLQDAAVYLLAGWFVAVIAVGGVTHNRRAYLREAERRAEAAEHGREEEARRRATEERLRIARELHDVLGHNISLINVQAAAALHGLRQEPSGAEAALTAIKQASKETLRELRTTLGVLRQVDEHAPVGPAPGLARLDELAEGTAAAGLAVRTETAGDPRPLPADTDLAAYRIVQEALTNITRHSAAASATVRIGYRDGEVLVDIEDPGPPAAPDPEPDPGTGPSGAGPGRGASPGTGSGIRGMRDRAEALGGDLTAGPRPGGGFHVHARLPAP